MKEQEQRRINIVISVYKEDIEKLEKLSNELNINRSKLIRELIKNAEKSEAVQANLHYQMFQDYINKCEEKYATAHNGQNDNKLTLKCSYSLKRTSKSEAVDNTTRNNTNKELETCQDIDMTDEEWNKLISDIGKPDKIDDENLEKQYKDFIKRI